MDDGRLIEHRTTNDENVKVALRLYAGEPPQSSLLSNAKAEVRANVANCAQLASLHRRRRAKATETIKN